MGTWGTGNLSNDTALDWFGAFSDHPDAEMIRETLTCASVCSMR